MNAQKEIRQLRINVEMMKGFTLQQSLDIALLTLHNDFGFGPDRNARFEEAFEKPFWNTLRCVWKMGKTIRTLITRKKSWTARCGRLAEMAFFLLTSGTRREICICGQEI